MNGQAGKSSKRRQENAKRVRDNLGLIDWGRKPKHSTKRKKKTKRV